MLWMPASAMRRTILPVSAQSASPSAFQAVTWTPEMPRSARRTLSFVIIQSLRIRAENQPDMGLRRADDVTAHPEFGARGIARQERLVDLPMFLEAATALAHVLCVDT
eukprot:Opistho-1_new@87226